MGVSNIGILKSKFWDYACVAGGLEGLVTGTIRIATHPPEYLNFYKNFDNPQYIFGSFFVAGGGVMLAYGIGRLIKRTISPRTWTK